MYNTILFIVYYFQSTKYKFIILCILYKQSSNLVRARATDFLFSLREAAAIHRDHALCVTTTINHFATLFNST